VSPLLSLIEDQFEVAKLCNTRLLPTKLDKDVLEDVKYGNFNLLIGTPEAWLNTTWRDILSCKSLVKNAVALLSMKFIKFPGEYFHSINNNQDGTNMKIRMKVKEKQSHGILVTVRFQGGVFT